MGTPTEVADEKRAITSVRRTHSWRTNTLTRTASLRPSRKDPLTAGQKVLRRVSKLSGPRDPRIRTANNAAQWLTVTVAIDRFFGTRMTRNHSAIMRMQKGVRILVTKRKASRCVLPLTRVVMLGGWADEHRRPN